MARAVKLLVIDAMRKTVLAVAGWLVARSWTPVAPTWASLPSMTTPQTMPGTFSAAA